MPATIVSRATGVSQLLCPICGSPGIPHVSMDCCTIQACACCRHQWAPLQFTPRHIEENYSLDYFAGGGPGYSNYLAESHLLRQRGKVYGELLSRLHPSQGTLLDVGAAAGFVSKGFSDTGWMVTPLEPNREMAEYGRIQLGLPTHRGSLEDNGIRERFDAVAMIQVLAHFTDPRKALQKAARLTKPGGIWLVETWDSQSFAARLLGRHWHEYSPPSALHYFTKGSLNALAAEFGFEPVAGGRPNKRIGIGHALSLLSYQMGEPRWMDWAKDLSSSLSLPYPGDDIFWTAFRQTGEVQDF
jgi:2-polyprenyl-3-methyl-5-hydroxy-6-metoxy-1,4-benzoquinol methylase